MSGYRRLTLRSASNPNAQAIHLMSHAFRPSIVRFFVLLTSIALLSEISGDDVTGSVQLLGNPTEGGNLSGREQSVWDLQAFEGKIYLGSGNTTTNPGRNDIWSYDPIADSFDNELAAIDSEAIENFRVVDGRLYVPAADPVSGDSTKYYFRDPGGGWQTASSSLIMAHIRDVSGVGSGKLIGVGNSRSPESQPGLVRSTVDGASFNRASSNNPWDGAIRDDMYYSILQYAGETIVTSGYFDFYRHQFFYPGEQFPDGFILTEVTGLGRYDPSANHVTFATGFTEEQADSYLDDSDFLPPEPPDHLPAETDRYFVRFSSTAQHDEVLAYVLRCYSIYDSPTDYYRQIYMRDAGLYAKTQLEGPPVAVVFPDAPNAVAADLLLLGETFYAVANEKLSGGGFKVHVFSTETPQQSSSWERRFAFETNGRIKSFEYLGGYFYFGVGADHGEDATAAGNLLRVPFSVSSVYAGWREDVAWGEIPVADRDASSDPDGDGIVNALEMFFGSDPSQSSTAYPRLSSTDGETGGRTLVLEYRKAEPSALCRMRHSPTLAHESWSSDGVTAETFNPTTGLYRQT